VTHAVTKEPHILAQRLTEQAARTPAWRLVAAVAGPTLAPKGRGFNGFAAAEATTYPGGPLRD